MIAVVRLLAHLRGIPRFAANAFSPARTSAFSSTYSTASVLGWPRSSQIHRLQAHQPRAAQATVLHQRGREVAIVGRDRLLLGFIVVTILITVAASLLASVRAVLLPQREALKYHSRLVEVAMVVHPWAWGIGLVCTGLVSSCFLELFFLPAQPHPPRWLAGQLFTSGLTPACSVSACGSQARWLYAQEFYAGWAE